jgi:hypothetical protein
MLHNLVIAGSLTWSRRVRESSWNDRLRIIIKKRHYSRSVHIILRRDGRHCRRRARSGGHTGCRVHYGTLQAQLLPRQKSYLRGYARQASRCSKSDCGGGVGVELRCRRRGSGGEAATGVRSLGAGAGFKGRRTRFARGLAAVEVRLVDEGRNEVKGGSWCGRRGFVNPSLVQAAPASLDMDVVGKVQFTFSLALAC